MKFSEWKSICFLSFEKSIKLCLKTFLVGVFEEGGVVLF